MEYLLLHVEHTVNYNTDILHSHTPKCTKMNFPVRELSSQTPVLLGSGIPHSHMFRVILSTQTDHPGASTLSVQEASLLTRLILFSLGRPGFPRWLIHHPVTRAEETSLCAPHAHRPCRSVPWALSTDPGLLPLLLILTSLCTSGYHVPVLTCSAVSMPARLSAGSLPCIPGVLRRACLLSSCYMKVPETLWGGPHAWLHRHSGTWDAETEAF